jgi:uncharacterized phage protein (TIGR02218 family)
MGRDPIGRASMKSLDSPTLAHLAGEELTLSTCWKIEAEGQAAVGFTDHDVDLTVSSLTYSSLSGYSPTNIQSTSNLSVDNLDIQGLLSALGITDADIQAGIYDHAQVWIFQVNWADTSQIIPFKYGHLGEVRTADAFLAEFRSLSQLLTQTIGDTITPDCNAELGDSRCGITLATYTVTGSVVAVTDRSSFTDTTRTEADDHFKYGLLTWTSGDNNGYSMEVKSYTLSTGAFELFEPMPYDIGAGDTYSVYAGCNKSETICKTKFSNLDNIRGFPNCPTQDQISKFGGQ